MPPSTRRAGNARDSLEVHDDLLFAHPKTPEGSGRGVGTVNGDWLYQELKSLRSEMNAGFRELRNDINARIDDHARRIRSLEVSRGWFSGATAVAGAMISRLWDWMTGR